MSNEVEKIDSVVNSLKPSILDSLSDSQVLEFATSRVKLAFYYRVQEEEIIEKTYPKKWQEKIESILIKNPKLAVEYAWQVKKSRWPEAEDVLLRSADPFILYNYALLILKDRWVEAEPIISNNQEASYHYARSVLKGRFPAAEHNFLDFDYEKQSFARDYVYELHCSKDEEIINHIRNAVEAKEAYEKAKEVVTEKWKGSLADLDHDKRIAMAELENSIQKHDYWWEKYQKEFIKDRLEKELKILQKKIKKIERQLA
jgi:hypothetical protein